MPVEEALVYANFKETVLKRFQITPELCRAKSIKAVVEMAAFEQTQSSNECKLQKEEYKP